MLGLSVRLSESSLIPDPDQDTEEEFLEWRRCGIVNQNHLDYGFNINM